VRAVGTIVFEGDARPTADGTVHHGLLDLEAQTACRVGSCCPGVVAPWAFDGRVYVAAGRHPKPRCPPGHDFMRGP
jgi:hypothetical protein